MKWRPKGVIFNADQRYPWMHSHAGIPVADRATDHAIRIYFSSRDQRGWSRPGWIEIDAANPADILRVHDQPILELGPAGTFDACGIQPSAVVTANGQKYLYYIAWNRLATVPYHLSIGLAIGDSTGRNFAKYSQAPILDRSREDPYFVTAPSVLRDDDSWKMWYVSCDGWREIVGRLEPHYGVKYAESIDGLNWRRTTDVCLAPRDADEAIGRPFVFRTARGYRMIFCFRHVENYRTDSSRGYRFGVADSLDGRVWQRDDNGIDLARSRSGWDNAMVEYGCVYEDDLRTYLFYNGNGFGASGIGYAILERNSG